MSKEEKLQRVDDVLEVLEIDHVRDTIIGDARVRGISGGQLKRVNIAMEMVSNPKLICLDEPTSGLDSVTSLVVLKALKEMAQTGVNVIAVLHQPKKEIFELFNQVLLLANGGLTAFIGSPIEMISYFENLGFPMPPGSDLALPGMFQQTMLLTYRAFLQRIRSPMMTVTTLLAFVVLGFALPSTATTSKNFVMYNGILEGLVLKNQDNGGVIAYVRQNVEVIDAICIIMFFMNMCAAIACCVSVSVLGGNERLVFFRETSTGQSVVAYFLSKVIETLAFMPIYAAAFISLSSNSKALLIQDTATYYLFTVLVMIFMYAVGFLFSLFLQSNAVLISLVAELMILIFFSGLTFPLAISEASGFYLGCLKCFPIFWSSQGLITEEFEHYSDIFDIARLNALTNQKNNKYGAPISDAGAGSGKGLDLGKGVGGNTGYCILALFGWYLLVLLTMKLSSFKKHR